MSTLPSIITSEAKLNQLYDFDKLAEDVATSRGLVVVLPNANQLQLDLDTDEAYEEFWRRLETLDLDCNIKENFSASGSPHRHIYLTFKDRVFSEVERILIQAALNDDPLRVFLNTRRLLSGIPNPTRLFESPTTTQQLEK